jgi:hypothetical protein
MAPPTATSLGTVPLPCPLPGTARVRRGPRRRPTARPGARRSTDTHLGTARRPLSPPVAPMASSHATAPRPRSVQRPGTARRRPRVPGTAHRPSHPVGRNTTAVSVCHRCATTARHRRAAGTPADVIRCRIPSARAGSRTTRSSGGTHNGPTPREAAARIRQPRPGVTARRSGNRPPAPRRRTRRRAAADTRSRGRCCRRTRPVRGRAVTTSPGRCRRPPLVRAPG